MNNYYPYRYPKPPVRKDNQSSVGRSGSNSTDSAMQLASDDSAILSAGPTWRSKERDVEYMSRKEGQAKDTHWFTAGHGEYCPCQVCCIINRRKDDLTSTNPRDDKYERLVKTYILADIEKVPGYYCSRRLNPMPKNKKENAATKWADAMKEMDQMLKDIRITLNGEWIEGNRAQYPNISIIVIDEEELFLRSRIADCSMDLGDLHGTSQFSGNMNTIVKGCMVLSANGLNLANPVDKRRVAITRVIKTIRYFNNATFRCYPLRIYIAAGGRTLQKTGNGEQTAYLMKDWVEELNDRKTQFTWIGTGLGRPITQQARYREFALHITKSMIGEEGRENFRAYDMFHGRKGLDSSGTLVYEDNDDDVHTPMLKPFLISGKAMDLPNWTLPKAEDNHNKKGKQARQAKVMPIVEIPEVRPTQPHRSTTACWVCHKTGHISTQCNTYKRATKKARSHGGTRHHVGKDYLSAQEVNKAIAGWMDC